jgi:hypothetical protein
MKPTPFRGFLATALLALAGCERHAPVEPAGQGIAIVDGRTIPVERLQAELARAGAGGDPDRVRQTLDDLILREQLVARALRLGLDRDPAVRRSWESALIARLEERELEPALRAAPAEADGEEAAVAPVQRTRPDEVRLAVLRLETHAKTTPEKLRRLESRLEEARTRVATLPPGIPGFGGLALEYSDDAATRISGGDLGWMKADPARSSLDPQAMAAGLALRAPGDVSPVIRGRQGVYLVRLIGRRAGGARPGAAEQDLALARHVRQLKRRKSVEADFLATIRRTIPVTVNTGMVTRMEAELRAAPDPTPESRLPF